MGDSQHGSAEGLGQGWLWPWPCPLSLMGEGQAAAAALSLPRALNQQCHLGNKPVISGDTSLGWHLWPGKATQGSPALLCHPLGTHGHAHRGRTSLFGIQPSKAEPWPWLPLAQLLVPSEVPWLSPPPRATAWLHCQCSDMTPETWKSCGEGVATTQGRLCHPSLGSDPPAEPGALWAERHRGWVWGP